MTGIVFLKDEGLGRTWGLWWLFRGPSPLQGWKRRGAGGFTLLALASDLRELVLLVN